MRRCCAGPDALAAVLIGLLGTVSLKLYKAGRPTQLTPPVSLCEEFVRGGVPGIVSWISAVKSGTRCPSPNKCRHCWRAVVAGPVLESHSDTSFTAGHRWEYGCLLHMEHVDPQADAYPLKAAIGSPRSRSAAIAFEEWPQLAERWPIVGARRSIWEHQMAGVPAAPLSCDWATK